MLIFWRYRHMCPAPVKNSGLQNPGRLPCTGISHMSLRIAATETLSGKKCLDSCMWPLLPLPMHIFSYCSFTVSFAISNPIHECNFSLSCLSVSVESLNRKLVVYIWGSSSTSFPTWFPSQVPRSFLSSSIPTATKSCISLFLSLKTKPRPPLYDPSESF